MTCIPCQKRKRWIACRIANLMDLQWDDIAMFSFLGFLLVMCVTKMIIDFAYMDWGTILGCAAIGIALLAFYLGLLWLISCIYHCWRDKVWRPLWDWSHQTCRMKLPGDKDYRNEDR
jgi:hypothetical protein